MKKISITRNIRSKGEFDREMNFSDYSGGDIGNAKQEYMQKLSNHRPNQSSLQYVYYPCNSNISILKMNLGQILKI